MRVLITGVTGQDGGALAEQLLDEGHEVYGLVRWVARHGRRDELEHRLPGIRVIDGDLTDGSSLVRALELARPSVVYNLGAIASSGQSWAQPLMMGEVNALGVLKLLEAIRQVDISIRLVHASTSEQYGRNVEFPQGPQTPFTALNVYGVAKTFAHQVVVNYRDSFLIHASTALMHNHVSLQRSAAFVDRKITQAVARIHAGLQDELRLGNTSAARDWGWGPEYMRAWPLIAAQDEPGDYVIATGESHTVQEFVEAAFAVAGLDWREHVRSDPALFRPTDTPLLGGDITQTTERLGWKPQITFNEIVQRLVEHDMRLLRSTGCEGFTE